MKFFCFPFLILLIGFNHFSQATTLQQVQRTIPQGSLTSGSIDSQFVYLNAISRTQGDLKLIRRTNLEQVRKNVADSISSFKHQLNELAQIAERSRNETQAISDSLAQTQQELKTVVANKDNFSFIGASMHKSTYNLIVWGIILFLIILLSFYIFRFRQSHVIVRDKTKAAEELQEAYDQHRKKSLEKEQKLKRQLQDEINRRMG